MTLKITPPNQKITVEGSKKELVEYIARGLLAQGFKRALRTGENGVEGCTFYSDNKHNGAALRCAVGQLVPDRDTYLKLCCYENDKSEKGFDQFIATSEENISILAKLQGIHDKSKIPQVMAGRMLSELENVCSTDYGLQDSLMAFMNTPL